MELRSPLPMAMMMRYDVNECREKGWRLERDELLWWLNAYRGREWGATIIGLVVRLRARRDSELTATVMSDVEHGSVPRGSPPSGTIG